MNVKTFAIALFVLPLAFVPQATAANPEQSGDRTDCTDAYSFSYAGLQASPDAVIVAVDPATAFVATTSSYRLLIDFYDASGVWVNWNAGTMSGETPPTAAFATICAQNSVEVIAGLGVYVPAHDASWTYQDGL